MELTAFDENKLTLREVLGIDEETSESLLTQNILITSDEKDQTSAKIREYLIDILTRTFSSVSESMSFPPSIEVIIGKKNALSKSKKVYVSWHRDFSVLISEEIPTEEIDYIYFHDAFLILVSCFVSAYISRIAIGESDKIPYGKKITLNQNLFIPNVKGMKTPISIGRAYLAGAGAIGNSFVYTLRTFDPLGELVICDDDRVSPGNLNRCIWFNKSHIGRNKAAVLSKVAEGSFPHMNLNFYEGKLATHPDRNSGARWLEKLIVAVDSRRARRQLQNEIPKEVFDASTTGIDEVFLYFGKRPLEGKACLECIYFEDLPEKSHELHMAESLNVGINDIEFGTVSKEAADRILEKYRSYKKEDLVGLAYDTLFKELCGKGEIIMSAENRHITAPFAFVSVLAGAILAIETIRRIALKEWEFNTWRVSPWHSPNERLKKILPTNPQCSFCNNKTKNDLAENLWFNC